MPRPWFEAVGLQIHNCDSVESSSQPLPPMALLPPLQGPSILPRPCLGPSVLAPSPVSAPASWPQPPLVPAAQWLLTMEQRGEGLPFLPHVQAVGLWEKLLHPEGPGESLVGRTAWVPGLGEPLRCPGGQPDKGAYCAPSPVPGQGRRLWAVRKLLATWAGPVLPHSTS